MAGPRTGWLGPLPLQPQSERQVAEVHAKNLLLLLLLSRSDFERVALRLESALLKAQLAELAGDEIGGALSGHHLSLLPGELFLKHGRSLLLDAQKFSQ